MQHEWIETNGQSPRKTEQAYFVRFRNGVESKQAYTASQLQWGHHRKGMCDDFDVVAVRKA
jgi:hypothetical protein